MWGSCMWQKHQRNKWGVITMEDNIIYLDNAASTKPYQVVLDEVRLAMLIDYGNPSALHPIGEKAKRLLEDSRQVIAHSINAEPEEIYFTSGATEANNWVKHIIRDNRYFYCSTIEHKSILDLSLNGNQILTGNNGVVSASDLGIALERRADSLVDPLISVMYVNNEVGTIQPIRYLSEIVHQYNGIFHTDATQAYTKIPIDVKELGVDMLSASGHKIYGPKGVGFLYISNKVQEQMFIQPLIRGGGQERKMRSGTENVPSIAGMAVAVKESISTMGNDTLAIRSTRDYMYEEIIKRISDCGTNVELGDNVVPSILNMYFDGVDGQELVILMGEKGVCASAGSACSSGNNLPSHVLKAMDISDERARSSVRFSLGHDTTRKDVDQAVKVIRECVESLRMF